MSLLRSLTDVILLTKKEEDVFDPDHIREAHIGGFA
jgi:hypothetical protein